MKATLDDLRERVVRARDAYYAARLALREATKNDIALRVCRKCKRRIASGHKWRFVTVKDITMTEHRTCKYPDAYNDEQGRRLS